MFSVPLKLAGKAKTAVRRRRYPFLRHEGMTGPAERMNLYQIAAGHRGGSVVELGPYFGASTAALAAGLAASNTKDARIHVFDAFQTQENTEFATRVEISAQRSGTQQLLHRKDGWLHWDASFNQLCAPFSDSLVVSKTMIEDADWQEGPVSVLHIDMPKDYEVGRHVFAKLFPALEPGSTILFQDFVYHWSAEMIAAFGYLMAASLTRPISIVSNTLTLECMVPGQELVDRLDADIGSGPQATLQGIEHGIDAVKGIATSEQLASLRVAYCQSLYRAGRRDEALEELGKVLRQHASAKPVIRAVHEVLEGLFQLQRSC